ncbi:hypothetical protein [Paenibacillus sp. SN-8-1]|uniref:hypothetical protein n=1 Tax=Paenibacillus sp. SN-8-1 TaxID=3435409 RepID=UPI003D9A9A75
MNQHEEGGRHTGVLLLHITVSVLLLAQQSTPDRNSGCSASTYLERNISGKLLSGVSNQDQISRS